MVDADVAVVGGGMAGVSAAAELAAEHRVVLLERERDLGSHTTARSAAQWQVSHGAGPVRALTQASRVDMEAIAAELDIPVLRPRATMWTAAEPDAALVTELGASAPDLVELIEPEKARAMCPALRADYVAAAAVEWDAQDVDVDALVQYFQRLARTRGATMLRSAPVSVARRVDSHWELTTPTETVRADVVVNAAGAWADAVATAAGVAPKGLTPMRRTALVASVPNRPVDPSWPLVADAGNRFYFRPEGAGVLASLSEETPAEAGDAKPVDLDIALTLERVNEATDLELRSVGRAWAGLRTFGPDRLPVVGFEPEVPGFCWLAGQGGYGIQTAPALARLTAALVRGSAVPADLVAAGLDVTALAPGR